MIPDVLGRCPLFTALDERQLAVVADGWQRRSLAAGGTLFEQGDPAQVYYVVERGMIKLARVTPEGTEKVIEMIRPGESFAEAVMFMKKGRYPVSAQAVADSTVVILKNRAFLDLLETDNTLALRMLAHLSIRMHGLVQEVEALTCHTATYRLISFLLSEQERTADTSLTPSAPKHIIASRLGITPETLSRLLHQLRSEGLVAIDGAHIRITDQTGLRSRLGAF